MRFLRSIAAPLALVVALTACSSAEPQPGSTGTVTVHASGPVWASVARAVAGDKATVTVTEMGPDQDPHSFEPSAQDKLAFSKATIVLINGGHYDEWAEKLVTSTGKTGATIDAVSLRVDEHDHDHSDEPTTSTPSSSTPPSSTPPSSTLSTPAASSSGEAHDHDHEANEHVFQSIPTVEAVSTALAERLGKADPANAATYTANAKAFNEKLHKLLTDAQTTTASHQGSTVVATEAVAGLLIEDLGLVDVTPEAYVEQSETDDGPSVATLSDTEKMVRTGGISMLLVNAQTTDNASETLKKAAEESGVPVVMVHETLPEGVTAYDAYMKLEIDAIIKALG